jgi:hypothetical protein
MSIDGGLRMFGSKRAAAALVAAAALAGTATSAVSALADQGQRDGDHHPRTDHRVLATSLVPSVPKDPALLGVAPGTVPWVLRSGEASLRRDGRLDVDIRGLVIPAAPFTGTTGPVKTVNASLYCGGSSMPVGTSPQVPISTDGNAKIDATIALPSKCQIPILLIHPNGASGVYIASSGFGA